MCSLLNQFMHKIDCRWQINESTLYSVWTVLHMYIRMYVHMYICAYVHTYIIHTYICSVLPRNNFRHVEYVCTYVRTYVCTCMSTPDIHTFIHTRTNAAQMLAASVLGATIKFYKRRYVGPTCLKIPGENSAYVCIMEDEAKPHYNHRYSNS